MEIARFFYKNESLLSSLYAQLFSGLLASVEKVKASEKHKGGHLDGKGEATVNVAVMKGKADVSAGINASSASREERKESLFPHDAAVLDVIKALRPSMKFDVENAKFGDIIYIKGDFVFIPQAFAKKGMELILQMHRPNIQNLSHIYPKEHRKHYISFIESTLKAQGDIDECRFIFISENKQICSGYLSPAGMTENQMSLFFKHGMHAIPAQMIAIMEKTDEETAPNLGKDNLWSQLTAFSSAAVQLWNHNMPPSVPVLPLTIFTPLNTEDNISE